MIAFAALMVAYRTSRRTQRDATRAQVDKVAIWCEPGCEWPGLADKAPRVEMGSVTWFGRNSGDLPAKIPRIAYEVRTKWLVPAPDVPVGMDVWDEKPGICGSRGYIDNPQLAPGGTPWRRDVPLNFAHHAPEGSVQITPVLGMSCEIRWFLVVDGAKRRWEVNPRRGRRARRIRWYSWHRRDYPLQWKRRSTMWLNALRWDAVNLAKRVWSWAHLQAVRWRTASDEAMVDQSRGNPAHRESPSARSAESSELGDGPAAR
jgi:hypothetical protein